MARYTLTVGTDHPIPVSPMGGTMTLTVDQTGGTVYYADTRQVSASANQGSIPPGGSTTLSEPVWLIGSAAAGVVASITSVWDEWATEGPGGLGNSTAVTSDGPALPLGASYTPSSLTMAIKNVQRQIGRAHV